MVELVGNIPDDVVLQARLDILYGQTPDITIKAHELPEESEPTVEKSGTLAKPVFNIGIPQAIGAVAAREYAKQAETARDAAILAGENAKEELNGIVASADDALDQKIAETGTLLDEKVATAAQRASEAASSAVAAAQKATAAEQAMQGAQAAQVQAEQSAQEAAENTAMAKDFASGQPVTYSGTPVSIAYAGAQRIASITAYGETPQGGTTEAPVALTGVDSVQVCGNNLLPHVEKNTAYGGVTITSEKDGYILNGTATRYVFFDVTTIKLSAGNYVLSTFSSSTEAGARIRLSDNYSFTIYGKESKKFNHTGGELKVEIVAKTPSSVLDNVFIAIQLNLGSTAMPYEPYQGSVTTLPIPRPLRRVGDVRDVCVTRQEYEGTEKLVVTYNVGFVELDGTENWQASSQTSGMFFITRDNISAAAAICSNFNFSKSATTEQGKFYIVSNQIRFLTSYETLESWKNYLAAQKAEGTPVQIAYQLATPETYATDTVDFDNAAGPLTVMTGGELEVRMTELVGSRSPEIVAKMDKATYDADGDGVVDKAASVPWDGVTSKPSTFAPSAHNHDDRYYTETETDTKLAGKANSSHTHGVADISGVLPATKGGTGANKSVLAISSAIVTTESQGYANVNISTNATICAVVSQGSATGQCYSISVIDPKTGGFSIQVKDYQGNPVANKTLRVNYIAYSI
nr:hypothetical protein [Ruthenibacterium lactatiformans]